MRRIIIILFFTVINIINIYGRGYSGDIEIVPDSLSMVSRVKADEVLLYFDTLKSPKLLYSVLDTYYYVIVRDEKEYIEYYLMTDSVSKITEVRLLTRTKRDNKDLSQIKPFELQKYHSGFITEMPDAVYIRGYSSYFVIKDEKGKRYGEFSLAELTIPIPIDGNLHGYLFRRLHEQRSGKKE